MSCFTCERCGYSTKIKCNLVTHLKRKTPCGPKHVNNDCELLLSNIYQQKIGEHDQFKILCEFCSKPFTTRQGKYQHKKFCKQNPNKLKYNNTCITSTVKKQNNIDNQHQSDVDELKKRVNQLMLEIEELKRNHTTQHTTVINIQQNTIILNSYNHVTTDFVHNEIMIKLLSKTYFQQLFDSLKEVVHLIYYNEQHPENHVVYIPNVRGKYAKVWNGNLWLIKNRDEILTIVRNRSIEFMNDFFFENENSFNLMQKQNLQKWHDRYFNDCDKYFDKKTKSVVEETILTYQTILKQKQLFLDYTSASE